MHSNVVDQSIEFLQFVAVGIVIALVFDFFRAYRKYKKVNYLGLIFQDILFFIITSIIIVFSIIYILDSNIRIYIFIAVIVGVLAYISVLSKYFIKLYEIIINAFFDTIKFIFLPFMLNLQINIKIYNFFKKYIKKCCKKFLNMISFICKKFKISKKTKNKKRGLFNMNKNHTKENKKGKMKMSILVFIVFMGYCIYTLIEQQVQINKYNSQISMYEAEIQSKNEMIEYYNNEKKSIDSDEYIENVARDSLGLVKPYEKIFIDANK